MSDSTECGETTWTEHYRQGHLCRRPKGHPPMHECSGCDMRWEDR